MIRRFNPLLVGLALFSLEAFASPTNSRTTCNPSQIGEKKPEVFSVTNSLAEMGTQFHEHVSSGRRLINRAYWEEGGERYLIPISGISHPIPAEFIKNVTRQIESALEKNFADFLFFSDFGHGHILVPKGESSTAAEALRSKETKILYHTAELLQLRGPNGKGPIPADPELAHRYYNRNLLGDNVDGGLEVLDGSKDRYNTMRSVPGYQEIGTFLLSASKDGCFAFRQGEKIHYFDIAIDR